MSVDTETINISGKTFLKCDSRICDWNVVCTPDGPSIPGLDFSVCEADSPRVCNFGIAAYRILGLPQECNHQEQVKEVLDRITYQKGDNEPYPTRE